MTQRDTTTPTSKARKPTINVLQAGRGFAALAVVLHHASIATTAFHGPFATSSAFELGYLGVDFFFVLSGFIIAYSTIGSERTGRHYAISRARRVYLPYLPLGIGLACAYVLLPSISQSGRSWSWLATLTLLPIQAETALSVAWTLKHELLFYAIFGVGFFSGRLWQVLALWGTAIIVAPFVDAGGYIALQLINPEFFFGIAVAIAYRKGWRTTGVWLLSVPILGLWIAMGAAREDSVLVGLAIAFAVLPLINLERVGRIKVPTQLVLLGAASYSIYLIHDSAISVMARLLPLTGLLHLSVVTMLAVIAGFIYFYTVEKNVVSFVPGQGGRLGRYLQLPRRKTPPQRIER